MDRKELSNLLVSSGYQLKNIDYMYNDKAYHGIMYYKNNNNSMIEFDCYDDVFYYSLSENENTFSIDCKYSDIQVDNSNELSIIDCNQVIKIIL